ncbi:MAG: hypothetical protein ACXWRA_12730 [Pseudobdellovibrionaceae bacterium]
MKSIFYALIYVLACGSAFGAQLYGKVVGTPSAVKVIKEDNSQAEYVITSALNTASVSNTSFSLSNNGVMAMCGTYLGQLAEDFSVTLETSEGQRKTVTIHKASGRKSSASVFGMCEGGPNILEQIQIDVEDTSKIEVQ